MERGKNTVRVKDGVLEEIVFDKLPHHDSTWGLTTGKDGRIYIAVCGEGYGGLSVFILSYDPDTQKLDYLVEVAPHLGEPSDSGHATQCKIHYCIIPGSDGKLYCATHASGPPWGDPYWIPWNTWDDPIKQFTGSHFFIFDPTINKINDLGIYLKKEGCRALAFDEKRQKFYGITWPRNHFFVFYLNTRQYKDLGRIGDINPQAVFLDEKGNAYTTDDYGYILKCNPETDELLRLNLQLPHEPYRRGWHNVLYDVVPSPDGRSFYGTDYGYESRIWKFDPEEGKCGKIYDLGRAFGPESFKTDSSLEGYQVRSLVFGHDQKLYYTMMAGWEAPSIRYLIRLNIETLEREVVAPFDIDGSNIPKILNLVPGDIPDFDTRTMASATQDYYGNLYFAQAGGSPTQIYIYMPDTVKKGVKVFNWKDIKQWG